MDTNINYTLVGSFVILLVAAIVFAIIWMSSGLAITQYDYYLIYSQESVSGLNIDANVEYNGVNVGSVNSVSIDQTNPHLVEVLLKVDRKTPITEGTVATLTSRGVTGVAFIALKDIGNNLQPLVAKPGQRYPVIPTTPSLFMRLDIALTRINKSFQTVSKAFQKLLDKENQKSIKDILRNLDRVTNTLSNNTKKLDTIINNTNKASRQLTPLIQQGNRTIMLFETQTLPATYRLLSNLNDVVRNLNGITNQLKENPSMLIRGVSPPPPGPGERK